MPQRARELHLTHRTGMADVLDRRDFGGHRITAISDTPVQFGQLTAAPHKQVSHRGQPLRNRGGLVPGGLTHHLDEIHIRQALEHMFDYATTHRQSIQSLAAASSSSNHTVASRPTAPAAGTSTGLAPPIAAATAWAFSAPETMSQTSRDR